MDSYARFRYTVQFVVNKILMKLITFVNHEVYYEVLFSVHDFKLQQIILFICIVVRGSIMLATPVLTIYSEFTDSFCPFKSFTLEYKTFFLLPHRHVLVSLIALLCLVAAAAHQI